MRTLVLGENGWRAAFALNSSSMLVVVEERSVLRGSLQDADVVPGDGVSDPEPAVDSVGCSGGADAVSVGERVGDVVAVTELLTPVGYRDRGK